MQAQIGGHCTAYLPSEKTVPRWRFRFTDIEIRLCLWLHGHVATLSSSTAFSNVQPPVIFGVVPYIAFSQKLRLSKSIKEPNTVELHFKILCVKVNTEIEMGGRSSSKTKSRSRDADLSSPEYSQAKGKGRKAVAHASTDAGADQKVSSASKAKAERRNKSTRR